MPHPYCSVSGVGRIFIIYKISGIQFSECLEREELHVAASYLLVLQSLESATVSRQHATQLLDAALDSGDWELDKDLIRFLRAIDPDECEELASPRISQILPPFSSPHHMQRWKTSP